MAKNPNKLKSLEDLPPDAAATDAAETIDDTIEALRGTAAALSGSEDPNVKEIEDMLKSNDLEGGTLRLSRRGPLDSGFAYIGKFRVKEFDIEQIKKVYGGGDYQAQTFRANGQMGKKVAFSIDPRFKGIVADEKGAIGSPGSGGMDMAMLPRLIDALKPAPVAQDTSFKEMMALMQQSSEKNMMMMMQMMQNSTQVMVAAMQTIGSRPESKPDNTALTAMMPVLIEMIRQQKGGNGLAETITTMKAVKELMTGEGGGEGGEPKEEDSFMMKLVKALGPTLLPVLAGAPAPRPASQGALPAAQPPARPQAQPIAQPGASSPPPPAPAPAQTGDTAQAIGMFAVQLVRAAEADSDPGLYHDIIVDALNEEQLKQLGAVLAQDNYLEQIYGAEPDTLARAKIKVRWFEGLRAMLLESLKGEQHDPATIQPAAPESGNEGS